MCLASIVSVLKYIKKELYLGSTSLEDWAAKLQIITALQVIISSDIITWT